MSHSASLSGYETRGRLAVMSGKLRAAYQHRTLPFDKAPKEAPMYQTSVYDLVTITALAIVATPSSTIKAMAGETKKPTHVWVGRTYESVDCCGRTT